MAYSDKVIDHYENPRNVGSFSKDDTDVGTGMVGAPACGDVMKLQIKVEDGVITDAKFKTYGCLTSNTLVNTPTRSKKIKDLKIDVYTTRPDTIFGVTFLVLAPEHMIVESILKIGSKKSRSPNFAASGLAGLSKGNCISG